MKHKEKLYVEWYEPQRFSENDLRKAFDRRMLESFGDEEIGPCSLCAEPALYLMPTIVNHSDRTMTFANMCEKHSNEEVKVIGYKAIE